MTRHPYCLGVFDETLAELLRAGRGVITADNSIRGRIARALKKGQLHRILPGTYVARRGPGESYDLAIRLEALRRHDPDAVVCGRAAAAALWWPSLSAPTVCAVRRGRSLTRWPGYTWVDRRYPEDRIAEVSGVRFTDPALTVLDLIPELNGSAIDEALRRRAVTLGDLHRALQDTPDRKDNPLVRELLRDSRDEPWSEAERVFHRIIRSAGLPWRMATNYRVNHASGHAFIDVALPQLKLGFEVDGREYHGSPQAFVDGHIRDLDIELTGWQLHQFAAITVFDSSDWVRSAIRRLCSLRAKALLIDRRAS